MPSHQEIEARVDLAESWKPQLRCRRHDTSARQFFKMSVKHCLAADRRIQLLESCWTATPWCGELSVRPLDSFGRDDVVLHSVNSRAIHRPRRQTVDHYLKVLGHQELDRQHLDLARAVASFSKAESQLAMTAALNDFFEIWRVHTRFEEELMRQSGFPMLKDHEDNHGLITREITQLFRTSISQGFQSPESITKKLKYWFDDHLYTYDTPLVDHLITSYSIKVTTAPTPSDREHADMLSSKARQTQRADVRSIRG